MTPCTRTVLLVALVATAVLISGAAYAAPPMMWNPNSVDYSVAPGESGEVVVNFRCSQSINGGFFLVVPHLRPFVTVEPAGYQSIIAGVTYQIRLQVCAPDDAREGIHAGVLRLVTARGSIAPPLEIKLNVTSEDDDEDDDDEEEGDPGLISGRVNDAISGSPLEGAAVDVYSSGNLVGSTSTIADGSYSMSLGAASGYTAVFSKAGYLSVVYNNIAVQSLETTYLETVLQVDSAHSGPGSVSGVVTDALSGLGVPGLTILLREGVNTTEGDVAAGATTVAGGSYQVLDLDAGMYTAEVSGVGYVTGYFTVVCIGGQNRANQNGTVTPELQSESIRIVLTWGATPTDLDSHLTGPLASGGRFHLYYPYAYGNSPWPEVSLDVDDVTSYGPETTTIHQQISGVYRFYVHDYSNGGSSQSMAMSNSGAQVRVYGDTGLVALFNVPTNVGGTLWTVFEISGSAITPVNTMDYGYVSDGGSFAAPRSLDIDNIRWSQLPRKQGTAVLFGF